MAIWQDLVTQYGFERGYQSVKRFANKIRPSQVLQARPVIITAPGEEAQVDYGTGPMVRDPQTGKYRRTRLFVLTLGYSRKSVRLLVYSGLTAPSDLINISRRTTTLEGQVAEYATVIIAGADRKFRIAFNGVENQAHISFGEELLSIRASKLPKGQASHLQQQIRAKHRMKVNPSFAAMIDVDAFQDSPISIDAQDFIRTSLHQIESGLQPKG